MAKPTLTDRIDEAIQNNNKADASVPKGLGPVDVPVRSYVSPSYTYDTELGFESTLQHLSPGAMRPMWFVKDQQQASVPVTALTSSGTSRNTQITAIQGGIAKSPRSSPSGWAVVPQMNLGVKATNLVVVSASVSVRSTVAGDTASFALYRDGNLVGNHQTQSFPSSTTTAMIQMTLHDNPPPGYHSYALYWSPGTGILTAVSNQRNMYVTNLLPR